MTQLTKPQIEKAFKQLTAKGRMPQKLVKHLKSQGWIFDDFSIEKKYKGYFLVIEFCIGDYCTYPCSKNGHWLLEEKFRAPNFMSALLHTLKLESRIDAGEHWKGEND